MYRTRLACFLIVLLFATVAAHGAATSLVANPASVTLNYIKGGTLPTARVNVGPSAGTIGSFYVTIAAGTIPAWLQVDKTNGSATATAPLAFTFTPSLVATTNPAGTYSAQVQMDSFGLTSILVNVNMTVSNAAATVKDDLTLTTTSWTHGSSLPTGILTVKSSGDPVYFSATATPSWIQ